MPPRPREVWLVQDNLAEDDRRSLTVFSNREAAREYARALSLSGDGHSTSRGRTFRYEVLDHGPRHRRVWEIAHNGQHWQAGSLQPGVLNQRVFEHQDPRWFDCSPKHTVVSEQGVCTVVSGLDLDECWRVFREVAEEQDIPYYEPEPAAPSRPTRFPGAPPPR